MKQSWLAWFLRGVLILGFLILIGRLIELQIIKGKYFKTLAEGNRIRRLPIAAPRGQILARGGELLVGNKEVKKRVVFNPKEGFQKLDDITNVPEDELISEPIRDYKLGASLAHVTGYLGEVNETEVGKVDPECPEKGPKRIGALTGRTGLEEFYECKLNGIDGEELVEVDSLGRRIRTLGKREPIPGQDLKTKIDFNLQKEVAKAMEGKKGAIVITDTKGEVLALYSSPSFDPNLFVKGGESSQIQAVLKNKDLPLFDRVISGSFAPGSVYKPVVAVAALEEGEIDENFIYEDTGQIEIKTPYGDFTYSNWYFNQYGGTEGEIDLVRAIARSTDTFFYKLGEFVGIDSLVEWSHKFNLGKKTQIDLLGEAEGLVPTPEWKKRVKGESWFLGNTYHMAIGQADLALTPLSVNTAISVIASEGELCPPKISQTPECSSLGLDRKSLDLVREGMVGACSQGGTGFTFFDFEPQVACKTGTAETNEEGKTHAWFTVFGPAEEPELVLTVLVEKGGEGSQVAAPIAREIFDYWFGHPR
ncbi:hypothetical protein E3I18_01615 [Candidatus Woesebacteria bacterium]|nr:MAG: hypothetical protein E3I18_01615 [Candidatus Woesebacteria bacterium]